MNLSDPDERYSFEDLPEWLRVEYLDEDEDPCEIKTVREWLEVADDLSTDNTILQIISRAHPDGADAYDKFRQWYQQNKNSWLNVARAAGAWLGMEMSREMREGE